VSALDLTIWLVAAVALYFGGPRVLGRFGARLEARRVAREARHAHTEQLLRDMFAAPGIPTEAVDRGREVHGMTVPELLETRERFNELVGREWPDQT
jgi:hypothetical protein